MQQSAADDQPTRPAYSQWRSALHETIRVLRVAHGFAEGAKWTTYMALDYTAYLDDSGTTKGLPSVAYAGYLSTARQWARFSKEWMNVCRTHGLSDPADFHASTFLNGKKVFGDWCADRRQALLDDLVRVIHRRTFLAFGCTVNVKDYEKAARANGFEIKGGAIGFCLFECANIVRDHMLSRRTVDLEEVAFVLDHEQRREKNERFRILGSWATAADALGVYPGVRSFTLGNRRKDIPLQAADLLAHQAFQHKRYRHQEAAELFNRLLAGAATHQIESPEHEHLDTVFQAWAAAVAEGQVQS